MPARRPPASRSLLAVAVGLVYPTFESFKAIESKGQGDDTQARRRGPQDAAAVAALPLLRLGTCRQAFRDCGSQPTPSRAPSAAVADLLGVLRHAALSGAGGLARLELVGGWWVGLLTANALQAAADLACLTLPPRLPRPGPCPAAAPQDPFLPPHPRGGYGVDGAPTAQGASACLPWTVPGGRLQTGAPWRRAAHPRVPCAALALPPLLAPAALPQGATFLYTSFVRPFLLVAVEKARELPALEPYVRSFAKTASKVRCSAGRGFFFGSPYTVAQGRGLRAAGFACRAATVLQAPASAPLRAGRRLRGALCRGVPPRACTRRKPGPPARCAALPPTRRPTRCPPAAAHPAVRVWVPRAPSILRC